MLQGHSRPEKSQKLHIFASMEKGTKPVKIIVAIDGYASCGKSTLAKALAKKLHYGYVDSGAMYRAVTLYCLDNGIDVNDASAVTQIMPEIHIRFKSIAGRNHTFLNEVDVEDSIREMRINEAVSPVSTIPAVRREMVRLQQKAGSHKGIVMDGRDIGTVVFPHAELKLFITADMEVRTQRRLDELQAKGYADLSAEEVSANLAKRDLIDSTREDSPLRMDDDAIEIDNSYLTPQEQLDVALELALQCIAEANAGVAEM